VKNKETDQAGPQDSVIEPDEAPALPDWELALTEVAEEFPFLDTDPYPSPLSVAVTALMRHLFDVGTGSALPNVEDHDGHMAFLAGGIEGGLRRMASAKRTELGDFLKGEALAMLFVKETWGPVFERMIEPLIREQTTWGDRPWPTRSKDQVALFGEYLSKDPAVVPALIAAVALGVRDARKREGRNQFRRRLDQVEELFIAYFKRRGRRSYCDFVHATATACFGPDFRIVAARLLDVAARALESQEAAGKAHTAEMKVLIREHRDSLAGKRVDVMALRRDKEKAVAAAQLEGMAESAERVRFLGARVGELEGELDIVRMRASREKAWLTQQLAATSGELARVAAIAPVSPSSMTQAATAVSERPTTPAIPRRIVAPPGPPQRPPLEGRRVFLYTNKERGGAREAFVAELEKLGASDPRVYETKGGSVPGPAAFPPHSVVIVDTTFMSHTFSNVIRRRARASQETLFLEDRFGVGGLAQRLARVSKRQ
jgi:hypothetical protein